MKLENSIENKWQKDMMGECIRIEIEKLHTCNTRKESNDEISIAVLCANIAAAFSSYHFLGTANKYNLKSVKSRIDMTAAYTYDEIFKRFAKKCYVATSEAKDETGEKVENPICSSQVVDENELGLAVDVIDGTTLAAKGLQGAYTLSAMSYSLKKFPDLQAYAVVGPECVINSFDFTKNEMDEAEKVLIQLSKYYRKPISELRIVTHSFDTGSHHLELINKMKQMGAHVIIPKPVIVEPTYMIGMALRQTTDAPDFMIGIFGLPEIVINSLILSSMTSNISLRFRVASNTMLKNYDNTSLCERFDFNDEEKAACVKNEIDMNRVYTQNSIADIQKGVCFAITSLTGDPLLGMKAIELQDNKCRVESLYSDFTGNLYKVITYHNVVNELSYTARYLMKIDDLSIVAFCKKSNWIQSIVDGLSNKKEEYNIQIMERFHITVLEIGIHYGGYHGSDMSIVQKKVNKLLKEHKTTFVAKIKQLIRKESCILLEVEPDTEILNFMKSISNELIEPFANVKQVPKLWHVTIAQFCSYLSQGDINDIDQRIMQMNDVVSNNTIILKNLELIHLFNTPFEFRRH